MIWIWINDTISLSSWCIPLLITWNTPLVCNRKEFHSTVIIRNAYVGQTCKDFHQNMPLDVNSIYMLPLFLLWGFPPFLSAKKVIILTDLCYQPQKFCSSLWYMKAICKNGSINPVFNYFIWYNKLCKGEGWFYSRTFLGGGVNLETCTLLINFRPKLPKNYTLKGRIKLYLCSPYMREHFPLGYRYDNVFLPFSIL